MPETDTQTGRHPDSMHSLPHNDEAERGLLGSAMIDPAGVMPVCERLLTAGWTPGPGGQWRSPLTTRLMSEKMALTLASLPLVTSRRHFSPRRKTGMIDKLKDSSPEGLT